MCYGARVEDPGNLCGIPASVRGTIAWLLSLGVIGWFIYVCVIDRPNLLQMLRIGFLAGVWSATGLVIVFNCSYLLRPGRVAGDDTMHAVQHTSTTSRVEGNYIIYTTRSWIGWESGLQRRNGAINAASLLAVIAAGVMTYLIQNAGTGEAIAWSRCPTLSQRDCRSPCVAINLNGSTSSCGPNCVNIPDDMVDMCQARSDCIHCILRTNQPPTGSTPPPPSAYGSHGPGCYSRSVPPTSPYLVCG